MLDFIDIYVNIVYMYIIYIDFIDESKIVVDTDDIEDEDLLQISLQEMLDDFYIVDDSMGDEDQFLYGRKGILFMLFVLIF